MTNRFALYVDGDLTWYDGQVDVTPDDAMTGLDVFLARMATRFTDRLDGGTVLLSAESAAALRFPKKVPSNKNSETHPILDQARNVGWSVKQVSGWMTFHRKRFDCPSVHIGVLPWLSKMTFEFIARDVVDPERFDGATMTHNVRAFTSLMGKAFRMNPGVTANVALMDMWSGYTPRWKPSWKDIPPANYKRENRYQWTSPAPLTGDYEHGWDIRQQYLAAAGVSLVALNALSHTGRKQFDRSPGWWLITVPEWNIPLCPHPAGNHRPGEQVWVSTATVSYMLELGSKFGVIAEPIIHDSWTATGVDREGKRIFRLWSERIRDAIVAANDAGNPDVAEGFKLGYKQAIGQWETPTGMMQRLDWADTVAANARINLHRKVWKEGHRKGGQWPSRIHHDAVFYESDSSIPETPETFFEPGTTRLSPLIGKFKFEKTLKAGEKIEPDGKETIG